MAIKTYFTDLWRILTLGTDFEKYLAKELNKPSTKSKYRSSSLYDNKAISDFIDARIREFSGGMFNGTDEIYRK